MSNTEQQQPGPLDLQIFESLPGYFLLLSPALHIIGMNDGYLRLTGKTREALTGQFLFNIFPESAQWSPDQNGGIAASLTKVQDTGQADELPVIRFDTPDENGNLKERYWKTVNQPVNSKDGQLQYIIHQTAEVTAEVLKEQQVQQTLLTEQKAAATARLQAVQMEQLFHDTGSDRYRTRPRPCLRLY